MDKGIQDENAVKLAAQVERDYLIRSLSEHSKLGLVLEGKNMTDGEHELVFHSISLVTPHGEVVSYNLEEIEMLTEIIPLEQKVLELETENSILKKELVAKEEELKKLREALTATKAKKQRKPKAKGKVTVVKDKVAKPGTGGVPVFTDDQVVALYAQFKVGGKSQREIAVDFNTTQGTVSNYYQKWLKTPEGQAAKFASKK